MSRQTYTTEQAADLLGVSPGRVRQMIVDGLLATERFGRAHVVTAEAIEAAKQRRTKPGPAPKLSPSEIESSTANTRNLNKSIRAAAEKEMGAGGKKGGKR